MHIVVVGSGQEIQHGNEIAGIHITCVRPVAAVGVHLVELDEQFLGDSVSPAHRGDGSVAKTEADAEAVDEAYHDGIASYEFG